MGIRLTTYWICDFCRHEHEVDAARNAGWKSVNIKMTGSGSVTCAQVLCNNCIDAIMVASKK